MTTLPTIHLNGTSRGSLLEELDHAWGALDTAYGALKRTAPNGRDYYVQGPDALTAATTEHMDRLRRVQAVMDELNQIIAAIA